MRKERVLLTLGVWVAILPYLGFPGSWKDILSSLTGLGMIYLAYMFYSQFKKEAHVEAKVKNFDNFKENNNFKNSTTEDTAKEITEENINVSFNNQEEI